MKELRSTVSRQPGATILAAALLLSAPLLAQVCDTSGPVSLSTQAQVASFQTDYGPCDTMSNDLVISGADISDLSPLGLTSFVQLSPASADFRVHDNPSLHTLDGLGLTHVNWLEIKNNPQLTSIAGLSTVTSADPASAVVISNNPLLISVDGLAGLSSLGGLILQDNASLADLSGTSAITSIDGIEGSLVIANNDALTDLDDLNNLGAVNGLAIVDNAMLSSISGLSNLTDAGMSSGSPFGLGGTVTIERNPSLASLAGLSGLSAVAGGLSIVDNDALTDLDPLAGIAAVGDAGSSAVLDISENDSLTDITGLANVQGVTFAVAVQFNISLRHCSILARLLDQVDDFAPGPGPGAAGVPDVGGDVILNGNLPGCNSIGEVMDLIFQDSFE